MFRRRLKLRAVAAAGGTCGGCRLSGPVAVLDFHHLDPSTKEFAIASDGIARSWQRVQAELAKCVLVCANCHREIHAGARVIERGGPVLSEASGRYGGTVA